MDEDGGGERDRKDHGTSGRAFSFDTLFAIVFGPLIQAVRSTAKVARITGIADADLFGQS